MFPVGLHGLVKWNDRVNGVPEPDTVKEPSRGIEFQVVDMIDAISQIALYQRVVQKGSLAVNLQGDAEAEYGCDEFHSPKVQFF